jgi:hypothetical protein
LLSVDATAAVREPALNQRIPKTLVVPLAVVMRNEFRHSSSEMAFAHWDHPIETFLLDRAHKSFCVGIRIRA